MPRQKKEQTAVKSLQEVEAKLETKRKRVSLACDACRAAREKCDGVTPECGTCVAQQRSCSYTPASRKRGVQTGYMRTIELSLAWMLEEFPDVEESFLELLADETSSQREQLLSTKSKEGNRLHKRWSRSQVNTEIGRLLLDPKSAAASLSTDESNDETNDRTNLAHVDRGSFGSYNSVIKGLEHFAGSDRVRGNPPSALRTRLPLHWKRYMDIYMTYTNSWLALVERQALLMTGESYPVDGLLLANITEPYLIACHAELWAVLAIGAYQDAHCTTPLGDGGIPPGKIYSTASSLIPGEAENFEMPLVRTLLLHSIILMGRQNNVAAGLMVGRATRLMLYHLSSRSGLRQTRNMTIDWLARDSTFAACFVLDTILSLGLQQQPHLFTVVESTARSLVSTITDAGSSWTPEPGFELGGTEQSARPMLTLYQLVEFSFALRNQMHTQTQMQNASHINPKSLIDNLVKSLHPCFSFCNALVIGASTPAIPSAFLLQIVFLITTMEISPGYRVSLLPTILELLELCVTMFGAAGVPSIVVTILTRIETYTEEANAHVQEKERLNNLSRMLTAIWSDEPIGHQLSSSYYNQHQELSPALLGDTGVFTRDNFARMAPTNELTQDLTLSAGLRPGIDLPTEPHIPGFAAQSHQGEYTMNHLQLGRSSSTANELSKLPAGGASQYFSQEIDYEAILDEMGSIAYENVEADPQFMTNLGFAPGCDLGEMFHGEING